MKQKLNDSTSDTNVTALHVVLSCSLVDMHNIFINYITEEKEANMHFSLEVEKNFFTDQAD